MKNINKFLQKLGKINENTTAGTSYQKYFAGIGLIVINVVLIFPTMKKYYTSLFSNQSEMTHMVCIY